MSIRKLMLLSTLGAMLALQSCEPQTTASDSANTPKANASSTGSIAFRLPAALVKSQFAEGYVLRLTVYGSNMDHSVYQEFPVDTNDIIVPNLRTGTAYVNLSLVNDQTQLNYYAYDTIQIRPYVLNRLSLTLRPADGIFPVGALQVVIDVDPTHRQDSAVYYKCQNWSADGKYCQDAGLTDSSVVGPWNCEAWSMVSGQRTCKAWLPAVATPNTDGYCAKRIEGNPMICTQTRDKYDPYFVSATSSVGTTPTPVK